MDSRSIPGNPWNRWCSARPVIQREIPEDKFVHQTYTQKDGKGKESTTNYVGPLLDAELFTDLVIVV